VTEAPDVEEAGVRGGTTAAGSTRRPFETNFRGALAVTDAFLPALRAHQGAVVNVLFVLSCLGVGDACCATKAALWSATNTQRIQLAPEGVFVSAVDLGYADTPMAAHVDQPKNDPADVVRAGYDGPEAGRTIIVDEISGQVKAGLSAPIEALYPQLAARG
jgi:NAD(P)-dependent dehydrogenase (short-subunit alcohol dehydrogenase family)